MPTLEWVGKDKVINHHLEVPYRVLEHQYTYLGKDRTGNEIPNGNKIIQGDNLEALKALLPQYEGRIKCIYIDPPYNTGNENWVYNDNVNDPKIKKWLGQVVGREGEDLSRHDKWLCMMYPRLKLLQRLLSDDGAIFISIDSSELSNLKLICDEIFGLSNFIDIISWFKKASPSNDAKYFSNDIEYILVYAKLKSLWSPHRLKLTEKQKEYYTNPDNDPRGPWNSSTYTCNKTKDERPSLYYPIVNPFSEHEIWPKETAVWKYSREQTNEYSQRNMLFWGVNGTAKYPRFKKFLSDNRGVVNRTLWRYEEVGHTQGATDEVNHLLANGFPTPKPSRLIERILQLASDPNSIILDSFAGSGTTAHAVLNMNKADGGNRKFILVEMMDYAETITAERVRRVIDGFGEGKNAVEGTGGSFSYYELGEPLLNPDQTLNENVPAEKIRQYVFFTETKQPMGTGNTEEPYLLGSHENAAYYFYYEKEQLTTLNHDFLATIRTKAENYVIYADICMLGEAELRKDHITFKKIPRDISRL